MKRKFKPTRLFVRDCSTACLFGLSECSYSRFTKDVTGCFYFDPFKPVQLSLFPDDDSK